MDRRIVEDVLNGTGWIIKSQTEAGGWPDLHSAPAPRDSMPDAWEQHRSLNPDAAADGPQDRDGDGYTSVEDYLNSLIPL